MFEIAPGRAEDREAVERICSEAFSDYGDFGRLVVKFYSTQGVHSFVAREADRVVGFVLLGFLPWTGVDPASDREWWICDLLAVAVAADRRGRGVGRALMERALSLVDEMTEWRDLKEIQLTCAVENRAGLALFERFGFDIADRNQGAFSSGQLAWRLARPLRPPSDRS